MNTSNIGEIKIVERFIKGQYVIIGTIEMTGINEWWWVCYDAGLYDKGYEHEPFHQGCATSRKDSIYHVRSEYRKQLKQQP